MRKRCDEDERGSYEGDWRSRKGGRKRLNAHAWVFNSIFYSPKFAHVVTSLGL